ncbi:universal stress protein [Natrialbaceae archaeon AArc-T1-2]|uniref:universal stress protein n=1 Tax=Natrialbaceae archaeon AArc-T1-2 TaxID=3053904 RepID=UPI00255B0391|nr:universal stress protein [Natrialbaceae archaeon AArc-T1-2]WIV65681.1 universal stress protein [Natrialbaceae archaeon AArc-T1-2]
MEAVFATDLSEATGAAIESRTCLECLSRIGVETVHVVTVVSSNVHYGVPGMTKPREKALSRQRRTIEDAGFDVDVHVVRGPPHQRINGIAKRVDADLILVGSRGRGESDRRVLGSTARNVVRAATRPVLVERIVEDDGPEIVREHLFERMLYATDFSENAERAFDQFRVVQDAVEEATLVHVQGPEQERIDDDRAEAHEKLETLASELATLGIDAETMVRTGNPEEEILAAEDEVEPTTVLVGARGLSRLRRLLLGSVSETVLEEASANVLVVPPRGRR